MRLILLVCGIIFVTPLAFADDHLADQIDKILSDENRPQSDKDRDRNRSPAKTLEFFQLKQNMRVLELVPGGGWYTRILAPILKDDGELFVAIGTSRVKDGLLKQEGFEKVTVLDAELASERDGPFRTVNIQPFKLSERNMDMVLTFRNMHNFTAPARKIINEETYRVLKPGGLYGVVDHTQRHMEPMTAESRRRIDPVVVIKEVLNAGFELVDFSDVHYRSDDELRYEVGRKSVTGNSDRFTLLFRKPK